ncbi:hypothetical protein [Kitasatospora sp. NPDC057541]|uniref:hypothetical protein n=1 Tax=unclassified Kitasatospora TaxID=2633591 RepID=UPI003695E512
MKRFVAVLAAGTALSSLGFAGAAQATAQTTGTTAGTTTTATTTCADGPVGALRSQVCVTIDGTGVTAGGYTSPTRSDWTAQSASYTLTLGVVGGASLGTDTGSGILPPGGRGFGYLAATAPCGSTVTATLTTTTWGYGATATVTAPVTC